MSVIKSTALLFLALPVLKITGQVWYKIPSLTLPLYNFTSAPGKNIHKDTFTVNGFDVSGQITLGLYKNYLSAVKRDSGNVYYLAQLPDSSITSPGRYAAYLTNPVYDTSPVAGVSWEAAMNFCKWMTMKNNPPDSILFIYSLPKVSEWIAAKYFLDSTSSMHDFSKNFSDWTTGQYFEGAAGFKEFIYDMEYFANSKDSRAAKRKRIAGNNFLFAADYAMFKQGNHFQNKGYRYVGFRIVRCRLDAGNKRHQQLLEYLNIPLQVKL